MGKEQIEGLETEIITNFSEMDLDLVRELIEFWSRQSAEDIYFRFFASRPPCEASFCSILKNYQAMIVTYASEGDRRLIVGYVEAARDRSEPEYFELGVAVDQGHRKRGIASHLIELLEETFKQMDIIKVKAIIMPGNVPMMRLIDQIGKGKKITKQYEDGCTVCRVIREP